MVLVANVNVCDGNLSSECTLFQWQSRLHATGDARLKVVDDFGDHFGSEASFNFRSRLGTTYSEEAGEHRAAPQSLSPFARSVEASAASL